MKYIAIIFCILLSTCVHAQFLSADVGINGLTCSQCCNSVAKQLEKLPFVSKVEMDLNETLAHVTFKKNAKVDWYAVPKAIKDAGFSIRDVLAVFNSDGADSWEERHFVLKNTCYSSAYPLEKGMMQLRFIGDELNAKGNEWSGQADYTTSCNSKDGFGVIQTNAKVHD